MGGGSQSTTQTTQPFTGQYAAYVPPVANTVMGNLQTPVSYSGQLSAGTTPYQSEAYGNMESAISNPMLQNTINGTYMDPNTNPYFQQSYNVAQQQALGSMGQAFDQVNSNFANGGMSDSSARMNMLNRQANLTSQNLSGLAANMGTNVYDTERQNQLNAFNTEQGLYQNLMGAGTQQQQTQQTADTNAFNAFTTLFGMNNTNVNNALNFLNTIKNPTTTSNTTSSQSPWTSVTGK